MGHDGGRDDVSEATWEYREHTSPSNGTSIDYIMRALNYYESAWGHWSLAEPASDADLYSIIATDVFSTHSQSSIQNVQARYLFMWHGYPAEHYDLAYGYNETNDYVAVADEWNHSVDAANDKPFGRWPVRTHEDLTAVQESPTREMVW